MKYVQGFLYISSFIILVNSNSKLSTNKTEKQLARITGGYRPDKFIFAKHIVSLRYGSDREIYGSNHLCGGSILSDRTILTAAHCVENILKSKLEVVVGSTDRLLQSGREQIFNVRKIVVYPQFDSKTGFGDVALLRLNGRIREDGFTVMRINLTDKLPEAGQECIFFGWGGIIFNGPLVDELVYMNVTLLPFWHCALFSAMIKGVICVGEIFGPYKIAANGDSGGPLICDGKLVGVASYIVAIRTYFSSVYTYREWIFENSKSQSLKNFKFLTTLAVAVICILML